jgi:hypothetical protein
MSTLNMLRGQIWLYDSNPSVGEKVNSSNPQILSPQFDRNQTYCG